MNKSQASRILIVLLFLFTMQPVSLIAQDSTLPPVRIVFQSERDGNSEIYSMNADGSDVTRLTDHAAYDGLPAYGPAEQQP